jgi:hypothetical protein
MLAGNNYSGEENLKACHERGLEPTMPGSSCKNRLGGGGKKRYEAADFKYREEGDYYGCPDGKKLEYKGVSGLGGAAGKHAGRAWQTAVVRVQRKMHGGIKKSLPRGRRAGRC